MRRVFAALTMFLVVAAPLAVEAGSIRSSEANVPRSERQDSNAPRGQDAGAPRADRESNAPRSPELTALDRVDQGSPAP